MTEPGGNVIPFPRRGLPVPRQLDLPAAPAAARLYRVRIDLDDVEPAIWRTLELASDLTLADFHEVVQTAMGWTDSHLHQSTAGPERDFGIAPFLTDFDVEEGDEGIHERDVRLDQLLERPGDRFFYLYDFGDGWDHTVTLESDDQHDSSSAPRARILDGQRACPPEDCGGVPGYEEIVTALADGPADADQRERLEWLGPYDPDAFSLAETDRLLQLTLASLGGAAGVESALAGGGHAFSEVLAELVERSSREPKQLARLLVTADLTVLDEPTRSAKAQAVRPWSHFLELVGTGITLTSAGWLPPTLVTRLATDLDLAEPWMGKANREQNFPPVRKIRETATALGLVRKRKGELLPTALGTRLVSNPEELWRHVADSLPLGGKPFETHAGAIMLLAVAAGESPYDGLRLHGPGLLWSAGWSDEAGHPPDGRAAIDFARPTWFVLGVMEGDPGIRRRDRPSEEIRSFARAALRTKA